MKQFSRWMVLTIFAVTILFLQSVFSQGDSTKVPFVSYWANGDVYHFNVSKIKKQWSGDELKSNDSSQYRARFEIMDSTETSYTIKWSFETGLTTQYDIPEKLLERFSKYQVSEIVYKTTEVGEFQEIVNWQEYGEIMTGLFTDLIEVMGEEEGKDKEQLAKAMQPVIQIYSSQEGIEQLVFKELQYFHFPFGVEYNTHSPIFYEEQIPNMLGGNPIKGNAKIYFESVDVEDEHCVMIQEMELDPDATKDLIVQFLERMGLDNKDAKKAFEDCTIQINDKNRFEFYYYPGIPVSIETRRDMEVTIMGTTTTKLDLTRIELTE